ncbi:MAG: hypothetical protein EBS21_11825 [Sphingomonadaceae bacterium]|nr:hypothetical protein [Sphingomonadaceae bacterium]
MSPNSPLGTNAAGTVVASGATLDLAGFTLGITESLTLSGTGSAGSNGALINSGSATTYSGLITLGAPTTIYSENNIILSSIGTITGSGFALTLDGAATGSSLASTIGTIAGTVTKAGAGTWTLSGGNTYSGDTTISAGTLSVTGTLGSGGIYSANISNSGTLSIGTTTQRLSGIISGTGALEKAGAGTLILSNANTYSGATTISAGTLSVTGTLGSGTYSNNISNAGNTFNWNDYPKIKRNYFRNRSS